jgi:hypothetical protein
MRAAILVVEVTKLDGLGRGVRNHAETTRPETAEPSRNYVETGRNHAATVRFPSPKPPKPPPMGGSLVSRKATVALAHGQVGKVREGLSRRLEQLRGAGLDRFGGLGRMRSLRALRQASVAKLSSFRTDYFLPFPYQSRPTPFHAIPYRSRDAV